MMILLFYSLFFHPLSLQSPAVQILSELEMVNDIRSAKEWEV